MNAIKVMTVFVLLTGLIAKVHPQSAELQSDLRQKIDAKIKIYEQWSTDSIIVKAVKTLNAAPPSDHKNMTNEQWKSLPLMSSEVRNSINMTLTNYIKRNKDESVSELFISAADGSKAAFLSKPTYWNHAGKPKHDQPMVGKIWIGQMENDESTGVMAIQISVPVLDGATPIGSIVIGFDCSKL